MQEPTLSELASPNVAPGGAPTAGASSEVAPATEPVGPESAPLPETSAPPPITLEQLRAEFAAWETRMLARVLAFVESNPVVASTFEAVKQLILDSRRPAIPFDPPAIAIVPARPAIPADAPAIGSRVKVWQDPEKKTFVLGTVQAVHDQGHSFDVQLEENLVHVQADGLELDQVA